MTACTSPSGIERLIPLRIAFSPTFACRFMIEIKNLHAKVGEKAILKGISLSIPDGEVHAVMGPNGSGKSTLSYVLAGRDGYEVTEGEVLFNGKDLLAMPAE